MTGKLPKTNEAWSKMAKKHENGENCPENGSMTEKRL